jgi:hypothetical protein
MDNFDLQKYLASGKIHADNTTLTEAKKQGYDDREDESLGARKGAEKDKKQSMKDRRDDSYGKFGKRDAEKKGKNKINKEGVVKENEYQEEEELELDADYDKGGKYYSEDGAEAFNIQPFKMNDVKYTKHEANRMGKYIVGLEGEELKKFISDYMGAFEAGKGDTATGKTFKESAVTEDEQFVGNDINANKLLNIFTEYLPTSHYHQDKTLSYDEALNMVTEFVKFTGMDSTGEDFLNHIMDTEGPIKEDARTDAEEEGYKDGIKDEKEDAKKMKVSELKAKIKETILAELSLSEADEEVDVDIDVEDEVEVEAGADDIEIERPGVKTTVDVGLSPEEEVVQDSLKAAMDAAQALGSDKLADQIGNTITFFTRQFVVGDNTD